MKTPRFLDRRVGYSVGALSVLFGMLTPALVPAFASADQVSSRSIQMSSAAASASASYLVSYTPTQSASYEVYWFCNDSPLAGDTCAAPAGMSLSSATLSGGTSPTIVTDDGASNPPDTYVGAGANYIVVHDSITTSAYTLTVNGVTNPSGSGLTGNTFYGRIETFGTLNDALAAGGDSANTNVPGHSNGATITNLKDNGGVAMALSSQIGISAAVRETMTFCASTAAPGTNCASANDPSMVLGEGSPKALSTSAVSTGGDYAEISTNAAHGAVVYMKNSNSCGGLKLFGASGCDIAPADGTTTGSGGSAGNFTFGLALFGVKLGSPASDGATGATGTITPNAHYTNYNMKTSGTVASDSSGTNLGEDVTSTYGGYLFGTNKAPINNQQIPLTFGASISNTTPAGKYAATIDLIAVGTY